MTRPRVLLISYDPVGEAMAGLGIRTYELGRVLARDADVTVAHGGSRSGPFGGVETVAFSPHDPSPLRDRIFEADAIVCLPVWPVLSRWLRASRARVIHDLYDPETLETLDLLADRPATVRRLFGQTTVDRLHDALRTGHHFMCASERQRDLWIGAMLVLRLIDPVAYDADPSFRSVIDTVPFGVPGDPPNVQGSERFGPRQRFTSVGADAELVLWNGGIWGWLDAETAIRAVAALAERRPRLRLVFLGASSQPAAEAATARARALASELNLLDRTVIFNTDWVAYEERSVWLAQADCAISTHAQHLETRFAFRTRLLDCFWAGVPVVCTAGDDLSDRVEREGLGATAPAGDHIAVAAALERVLNRGRDHHAVALAHAAEELAWTRVAAPLARWVASGETLPARPGEAPGALRPGFGQRVRSLGYRAGGNRLLARRSHGANGI